MNLKTLRRHDPYIEAIKDSASQVALYKFVQPNWQKTDIEGTLFVYKRNSDPEYGFLILNRKSNENQKEPVTKELDFQLQAPFLLYKNKEGVIYGIWFYEKNECEHVHATIMKLLAETEAKMNRRDAEAKGGGKDLESLLKMAAASGQNKKHQQQKSKNEGDKLMKLLTSGGGSHVAPPSNEEGGSVAAFFAKAEQQVQQQSTSSAFTAPAAVVPAKTNGASVMPPIGFPGTAMPPGALPHLPIAPMPQLASIPGVLQHLPGVHSVESLEREHRQQSISPANLNGQGNSVQEVESAIRTRLHVGEQPQQQADKVELLSPMAFANPQPGLMPHQGNSINHGAPRPQMVPVQQPIMPVAQEHRAPANSQNGPPDINPLTPAQLAEAFQFLLQTDPTFIAVLHEGYIRCLNKKLSQH